MATKNDSKCNDNPTGFRNNTHYINIKSALYLCPYLGQCSKQGLDCPTCGNNPNNKPNHWRPIETWTNEPLPNWPQPFITYTWNDDNLVKLDKDNKID